MNYGHVWIPRWLLALPGKASHLVARHLSSLLGKLAPFGKEILAEAGEPNRLSAAGKICSPRVCMRLGNTSGSNQQRRRH